MGSLAGRVIKPTLNFERRRPEASGEKRQLGLRGQIIRRVGRAKAIVAAGGGGG